MYGCVLIVKSEGACVHEPKILSYHTSVLEHCLICVESMGLKSMFVIPLVLYI